MGAARRVAGASVAVALAFAVVARTGPRENPDDAREPVQTLAARSVVLPDEMIADGAGLWVVAVLPPGEGLAGLVAWIAADPGEPPQGTFWQFRDGPLQERVIDLGVSGSVEALAVAASAELTALAGYAWDAGTSTSFLLTSADRITWRSVPMPAPAGRGCVAGPRVGRVRAGAPGRARAARRGLDVVGGPGVAGGRHRGAPGRRLLTGVRCRRGAP